MRILVIDSDRVGRAVQRMLPHATVTIEPDAANACRRISLAEAEGHPFEVILCDLEINARRGTDLVRTARERQESPLFIFAVASEDHAVPAAWLGDGVLFKPFRADELVDVITRLRRKRSRTITRRLRAVGRN